MSFSIQLEDLKYPRKHELWETIESNPQSDIFAIAEYAIAGSLVIRENDKYLKFHSDLIAVLVQKLVKNAFWMSFTGNRGDSFEFPIPDSQNASFFRGTHYVSVNVSENGVEIRIGFTEGAQHNTNIIVEPQSTFLFETSLLHFNRAIWKAYSQIIGILENQLEGIDGFDEQFHILPFMGEQN